uniref:tRNA (guanine-N(7)-)-methyltransferase n=1 Tax=Strigamia maritima TaxID=126957 RepID=T1JBD7_STRMM
MAHVPHYASVFTIRQSQMEMELPQKRYYRQRAHSNPIADHCLEYPHHPDHVKWNDLFSVENSQQLRVDFVDVGCGYGGLLIALSPLFPDKLVLGIEIRVKVSDYVQDRIRALRHQNPGKFENVACIRSNAMKYLPNFFHKSELSKLFFLYPDPHFKKAKHKWRIISPQTLAEFAYVLRPGGRVYLVTDVKDLFDWMMKCFDEHPLFQQLDKDQQVLK